MTRYQALLWEYRLGRLHGLGRAHALFAALRYVFADLPF